MEARREVILESAKRERIRYINEVSLSVSTLWERWIKLGGKESSDGYGCSFDVSRFVFKHTNVHPALAAKIVADAASYKFNVGSVDESTIIYDQALDAELERISHNNDIVQLSK